MNQLISDSRHGYGGLQNSGNRLKITNGREGCVFGLLPVNVLGIFRRKKSAGREGDDWWMRCDQMEWLHIKQLFEWVSEGK